MPNRTPISSSRAKLAPESLEPDPKWRISDVVSVMFDSSLKFESIRTIQTNLLSYPCNIRNLIANLMYFSK
jgi:hypothetical protein